MNEYEKLQETTRFLVECGVGKPLIGIVLGTGLGKLIGQITIDQTIDYEDIPNFPVSTVEFHKGKLIFGRLEGKRVVAMQGRFHLYEGYSANDVVFPIRVMKILGIRSLVLTNAAGAINLEYKKGQVILVDDHINLLNDNPLLGENIDELGDRFPDMSAPYDKPSSDLMISIAKDFGSELKKGVYASVTGPNLETRAEYRFLRTIGADLVGMSTVPEVIAANHMKLTCVVLSVVTDLCDPDNLEEVDIAEIIANAEKGEEFLLNLIPEFVKRIEF